MICTMICNMIFTMIFTMIYTSIFTIICTMIFTMICTMIFTMICTMMHGSMNIKTELLGILTLEDGTDRLFQNIGNELPLLAT